MCMFLPVCPLRNPRLASNLARSPERYYAVGIVYRYHKPRPRDTKGKCLVHNLPFERETIAAEMFVARRATFVRKFERGLKDFFQQNYSELIPSFGGIARMIIAIAMNRGAGSRAT